MHQNIIYTFMIDYIIYYKLTKFHKKSKFFFDFIKRFLISQHIQNIQKDIHLCNWLYSNQSVINCNPYYNQPKIIDLCTHEICIFFFTFVTRWSCETGHVTVACITVPLLYARAMIRAHVVCTFFTRMQIGVHITTGFY